MIPTPTPPLPRRRKPGRAAVTLCGFLLAALVVGAAGCGGDAADPGDGPAVAPETAGPQDFPPTLTLAPGPLVGYGPDGTQLPGGTVAVEHSVYLRVEAADPNGTDVTLRAELMSPDPPGTTFADLDISGAEPVTATERVSLTLAGTPLRRGRFPIRFTATDAGGKSAELKFVLTVADPPIISTPVGPGEVAPAASGVALQVFSGMPLDARWEVSAPRPAALEMRIVRVNHGTTLDKVGVTDLSLAVAIDTAVIRMRGVAAPVTRLTPASVELVVTDTDSGLVRKLPITIVVRPNRLLQPDAAAAGMPVGSWRRSDLPADADPGSGTLTIGADGQYRWSPPPAGSGGATQLLRTVGLTPSTVETGRAYADADGNLGLEPASGRIWLAPGFGEGDDSIVVARSLPFVRVLRREPGARPAEGDVRVTLRRIGTMVGGDPLFAHHRPGLRYRLIDDGARLQIWSFADGNARKLTFLPGEDGETTIIRAFGTRFTRDGRPRRPFTPATVGGEPYRADDGSLLWLDADGDTPGWRVTGPITGSSGMETEWSGWYRLTCCDAVLATVVTYERQNEPREPAE
jgi:hypothetical protein